jgi:hypothetical protein
MKVLIGGIVGIIPIVNFAALGYMVTAMKNVADGQPQPLPEWSNFGDHFMKGLYVFVGYLIYFAPALIVYCCVSVVGGVAGGALGSAGSGAGRDAAGALGGVMGIVMMCLYCVMGLLVFVASVLFPAALVRFAMSQNQLSLFWDFRGTFDLVSKNVGNYVMAILIALVAGFIAGFGIILCVVGMFFTQFWSQLVTANVLGQFWRASQGQTAAV